MKRAPLRCNRYGLMLSDWSQAVPQESDVLLLERVGRVRERNLKITQLILSTQVRSLLAMPRSVTTLCRDLLPSSLKLKSVEATGPRLHSEMSWISRGFHVLGPQGGTAHVAFTPRDLFSAFFFFFKGHFEAAWRWSRWDQKYFWDE